MSRCIECHDGFASKQEVIVEKTDYCQDCAETYAVICSKCDEYVDREVSYLLHLATATKMAKFLCPACYASDCSLCHETIDDQMISVMLPSRKPKHQGRLKLCIQCLAGAFKTMKMDDNIEGKLKGVASAYGGGLTSSVPEWRD